MTLSAKLIEQRDALVAEVETTLAAEDVTAEALDAASAKQEDIAKLDERIATVAGGHGERTDVILTAAVERRDVIGQRGEMRLAFSFPLLPQRVETA